MMEVRVLSGGEEEKLHVHTDYEIFLVLTGEALIANGPHTYTLKRDGIFFINTNVKHRCQVSAGGLVLCYQISYHDTFKIVALPYLLYDLSPGAHNLQQLGALRGLLKNIATLSVRGTTLDNIQLQSLYNQVLYLLVENFSNWSPDQLDNITLSKDNRLQHMQDYIINNCDKQLSLQHLADRFDLSVPYLSKYIKRELGMGFVQYVNNIRLYNAVDQLTHTSRPVTQIAYDNGFTNLTSFNKLFKATFQCSPSAYRKQNTQPRDTGRGENHTAQVLQAYLADNPFTLAEEGETAPLRISLDLSAPPQVLYKNWNILFTFGASHRLLDSGIQEHVLQLCRHLGFTHLRIWGLFSEENSVDKNSVSHFNFTKLNQIFDFLHKNGLVPHIDLGFQADEVYGGFDVMVRYRQTDIQFTELSQYSRLLSQFIKNAINRYGMDYVSQWNFEFWKDPRLDFDNTEVTYFTVFDVAYEAIKKILPQVEIGGCGLTILGSMAEFEKTLQIWSQRPIVPDFFTVTLYPYHYTADQRLELSQDADYFVRSIGRLKDLMGQYGMGDKKLYINGWNLTRSSRNSINDSCYKAAYIVKNTLQCLDKVNGIAYNGSTDLLDEHFDTPCILTGGLGLLTKDGIRKPAYYAYQFLHRLGGKLLALGENYIVTQDHDDILLLCHNCIQPGLDYYLHHKDDVKPAEVLTLFAQRKLQVQISLAQVPGREYVAKKYRLHDHTGSILDIWMQAGMPDVADMEDIQYFQALAIPQLSSTRLEAQLSRLHYKTQLECNEIQLIHFKLQA